MKIWHIAYVTPLPRFFDNGPYVLLAILWIVEPYSGWAWVLMLGLYYNPYESPYIGLAYQKY